MNHPSFQFYPGDWLRDDVSGLSLASQGLWLRLLIVMHDSPRRGFLTLNNGPMPAEVAARKCGTDLATYELLLKELEDAGVASRSDDGSLFSRRMVRDEQARTKERVKKRKQRGKNEHYKDPPKHGCPPGCPDDVPRIVPALSPHSSSSSSSSSSRLNTNTPPLPPCGGNVELQSVLADWLAYKAERGERYKSRGLAALETQFVEWGTERARAAVEFSKRNQYKGLFEPNTQPNRPKPSTFLFKPPSET